MFAEWIRDELTGMQIDFSKEDIHWLRDLPDEDLEQALGDWAPSTFWDVFRIAVKEMAVELLVERDSE